MLSPGIDEPIFCYWRDGSILTAHASRYSGTYEEGSFEHFKHAENVGEIQYKAESEPGKLKELVEKL